MPFDALNNNSGFGQNLVQSPNWPLVQGLKPWVCSPDGVFSLCLICVAAKTDFRRITASATRVVRGQKSRLLLLPWLSIICKLAWGVISQTNAHKQRKKNIAISASFCHLWKEAPVMLKSQRRVAIWSDSEYSSAAYALILSSQWLPVRFAKSNPENLHE